MYFRQSSLKVIFKRSRSLKAYTFFTEKVLFQDSKSYWPLGLRPLKVFLKVILKGHVDQNMYYNLPLYYLSSFFPHEDSGPSASPCES
jgi:hypothetical protein